MFINYFVRQFLSLLNTFIYLMAVISHLRCCFTDPGAVPSNATWLPNATEEEKLRFCPICNAYKPPRAHHCSQCQRCIIRMDHHCPWTNNCIGYRNMKFFILFLGYVMAMCAFTFIMDCFRLYYFYIHSVDEPTYLVICTMITMSLSCIFIGFSGAMFSDSLDSIRTDTTSIDRLKGEDYNTHRSTFSVYFGDSDGFSVLWLLPILPHFPSLEDIEGSEVELLSVWNICLTRITSYTRRSRMIT